MLKLLIRLSALSLGLSCVVCSSSSQSQLASLNERMNQMLSALYASPLLSKQSSSTEESSDPPETSYIVTSGPPQVVFVTPSPYLETGAQPNDHGYPTETHPVARSAWPYPYEYSYPQYPSLPRYPEARPIYPPIQTNPFPSAYSPLPYGPAPYPSQAPIPSYQPFTATNGPYPQMYQVQPQYPPVPQFPLPSPIPSYPIGYPAPYVQAPQYPGYPAVLPGVPQGYPALPAPFPSQGYLSPAQPSPYLPAYPPAYPKYSEILHHPFDFNKI